MTDSELEKLKEGFPVWIKLPVTWGDQDAFLHVNNTVYIRWFESARIAYGDRAGMDQRSKGHDVGPILAAISCNYRRQLTYPDTVHIGARVTKIGNSSFKMEHRVISEAHGAIAADGDSTLVAFDYTAQKPVSVPQSIRETVAQIEGRPV